jgi:hypothetical protein
MVRCNAIKANGERCKGRAMEGSEWCWSHDPSNTEAHRRHGSKGGKRGGRGRPVAELGDIKARLSELVEDVREGRADRADAAVVGQLYNTVIRAIGMEMKVRETDELTREVEELREMVEANKERNRYGVS